MKDFFKELLAYSHKFNLEIAELLIDHSELVSEKSTKLFGHLLSAHHIWNCRILGEPTAFEVWQTHLAEDYINLEQTNFETTTSILAKENLSKIILYKNSRGDAFENTVRDILFHIINHSTYHRAQIATELKNAGITPPSSDWIMYKR
nr:DinB family protein [uncultured Pedobacter sp.]